MNKVNHNLNSIIRVLLTIVLVSGIVNTYLGKGDCIYYISEGLIVICSVMSFILAVVNDIVKDHVFQEEWA